jgi:hypothetical protein
MKNSTLWIVWAALFIFFLMGWLVGTAQGHGIGKNVPNHHRWIQMAEKCETKGITDRWRFDGHHDGALQFDPGTWTTTVRGYPKLQHYRYAFNAPPWAQMAAANILKRQRGLQPWTCGWAY